ncbi:MAG: hypothetical protein HN742_29665 [Lentisphaerae bacterium]|jgi:hypothetical protein|nr:hypothetical protein [Lentisphaerota bacterium]MBT4820622.1 hypothetical protein [Lentisphaerota bacterium]MBT5612831.1 hypothetical protein [Lentisphaerota bacterium]MBT7059843.1 hypothetical protein [Lentisphaerota bacterium]MBT7846077.1 hypothetical protein [Lentisphaerota bacterium]
MASEPPLFLTLLRGQSCLLCATTNELKCWHDTTFTGALCYGQFSELGKLEGSVAQATNRLTAPYKGGTVSRLVRWFTVNGENLAWTVTRPHRFPGKWITGVDPEAAPSTTAAGPRLFL